MDEAHLAELEGQSKHRRKWRGSRATGSTPGAINKHPEKCKGPEGGCWMKSQHSTVPKPDEHRTMTGEEGARPEVLTPKRKATAPCTKKLHTFSSLKFQGVLKKKKTSVLCGI